MTSEKSPPREFLLPDNLNAALEEDLVSSSLIQEKTNEKETEDDDWEMCESKKKKKICNKTSKSKLTKEKIILKKPKLKTVTLKNLIEDGIIFPEKKIISVN
eukprot:Sdes_comp19437_c0_seq1m10824